jgi:hypothetical protein
MIANTTLTLVDLLVDFLQESLPVEHWYDRACMCACVHACHVSTRIFCVTTQVLMCICVRLPFRRPELDMHHNDYYQQL